MSTEMGSSGAGVSTTRVREPAEAIDLSPADGFSVVKVLYEQDPEEAQTLVARFDSAADVVVPSGTPKIGYVVYDADGNTYTREEFRRHTQTGR